MEQEIEEKRKKVLYEQEQMVEEFLSYKSGKDINQEESEIDIAESACQTDLMLLSVSPVINSGIYNVSDKQFLQKVEVSVQVTLKRKIQIIFYYNII